MTTLAAYAAWGGVRVLRCLDGQLVSALVGDHRLRPIIQARDVALTDSPDVLVVATEQHLVVMAAQPDGSVCRKPEYSPAPFPVDARLLAATVDSRGTELRTLVTTPTESQTIELCPVRRSTRIGAPAVAGVFVESEPAVATDDGLLPADAGWDVDPGWLAADAMTVSPGVTALATLHPSGVALACKDTTGTIEHRWLPGTYEGVAIVRERERTGAFRIVTLAAPGDLELHEWASLGSRSAPLVVPPQQNPVKGLRVFVSYAHDREHCNKSTPDDGYCCTGGQELAARLVDLLVRAGHQVRWDRHLHGRYRGWIQKEIQAADVMVLLWTPASVDRVNDCRQRNDGTAAGQLIEINEARENNKRIVPILTAEVTADSVDWDDVHQWSVLKLPPGNDLAVMQRRIDEHVRDDSSQPLDYSGARSAQAHTIRS